MVAGATLAAEDSCRRHWNNFLNIDRAVLCLAVPSEHLGVISALYCAVFRGLQSIVKVLLAARTDVNNLNVEASTLVVAAQQIHFVFVKALLTHSRCKRELGKQAPLFTAGLNREDCSRESSERACAARDFYHVEYPLRHNHSSCFSGQPRGYYGCRGRGRGRRCSARLSEKEISPSCRMQPERRHNSDVDARNRLGRLLSLDTCRTLQ